MESPHFECPHCQGRLARGVSVCLHCGASVEAPPESTGAMKRFIVTGSVILVVLGAASAVLLPMLADEEAAPAEVGPTCVSVDDPHLEVLTSRWREVPAPDGKRCFRPRDVEMDSF